MRRSLALFIAVMVLSATGCTVVESGHVGAYFNWRTGTDTENVLHEGFHLVAPWNRVIAYSVRVQDVKENLKILTKDQLNISVEVSIRFRVISDRVGMLHKELGPAYEDTIIRPTLRNVAREVIAAYESTKAYMNRPEIQLEIQKKLGENLPRKFYEVQQILLRNMDFPKVVEEAIQRKLSEKQEAERMLFVLEKEQREAERKKVEAKGIADFQAIVSTGITENLLRWKGIEATLKLAESENSKIVVVGGGKDGLPLILGNAEGDKAVSKKKKH